MADTEMGLDFQASQSVPDWGSSGALRRTTTFTDETDRINVAVSARTVGVFAPYVRSYVDFDLPYEEAECLRNWLTDRLELAEKRKES